MHHNNVAYLRLQNINFHISGENMVSKSANEVEKLQGEGDARLKANESDNHRGHSPRHYPIHIHRRIQRIGRDYSIILSCVCPVVRMPV